MKIALYGVVLALGSLSLASCGNDDVTNEIAQHGVDLLSAQTKFEAAGGTDSIVSSKAVVKAYATADWATVKTTGTLVEVTAGANKHLESRHATVVVKTSEQDSAIVPIDQLGSVTFVDAPEDISFGDKAATYSYTVKSSFPFTVSSSAQWLKCSYEGGKLKLALTENATGHVRTAWVHYAGGLVEDSVLVRQADFDKDLAGNYYLQFVTTSKGQTKTGAVEAQLSRTADNNIVLTLPDLGFTFHVTCQGTTLTLAAGDSIGKMQTYFVYALMPSQSGGLSWDPSLELSGSFDYDTTLLAEGLEGTYLSFGEDSQLALGAFSSTELSGDTYVGNAASWRKLKLFKAPASGGAKKVTKVPLYISR